MKNDRVKDASYYMDLPYTLVVRRDEDGDFIAKVDELPGCSAHGSNPSEALEHLKEAQQLWVEDAIEAGQPPPEPEQPANLPSGKWLQRVPRSLHQKLSQLAKRENVSLNQLVTSLLSEAVTSRLLAPQFETWHGVFGAHPGDPWDSVAACVPGTWSIAPAAESSPGLVQSLRRVGTFVQASKKISFPLKNAYKKEIEEYNSEYAER